METVEVPAPKQGAESGAPAGDFIPAEPSNNDQEKFQEEINPEADIDSPQEEPEVKQGE